VAYSLPGELGAWPTAQIARRIGVARSAPSFARKLPQAVAKRATLPRRPVAKAAPVQRIMFRRSADLPSVFRPSFAVIEDYPELLGEYPEQVDLGLSFKSIGRAIGKAAKAVEKKVTRPVAKYVKKHPLVLAPLALAIPGAAPAVLAAGKAVGGGALAVAKGAAGGALKFASGAKSLASRLFGGKGQPTAEDIQTDPSFSTMATPGTINTIPSSVLPSTNGTTAAPEKSIAERVAAEVRRFNERRARLQSQAQSVIDTGQAALNQAGVYAAGAGGAVQGAAEGAERGMYEAGMIETARQQGQSLPPWVIPVGLVAAFAFMKGGGSRNW